MRYLLPALCAAALAATGCGSPPPTATDAAGSAPAADARALLLVTVLTRDGSTCGLATTGEIWCWGRNSYGVIGDGTTIDRLVPTRVPSNQVFSRLAMEDGTACALAGGEPWCWGSNAYAQIDLTLENRVSPTRVPGAPALSDIGIGSTGACGLAAQGEVWCWGTEQGFYQDIPHHGPEKSGGSRVFSSIDTNIGTCAWSAGARWCLVTYGSAVWTMAATPGNPGAVQISGNCFLDAGGKAWCTGYNREGEAGTGTTDVVPLFGGHAVNTSLSFVQIGTGRRHGCARTAAGAVWCWGSNVEGQIGDGTFTQRLSPVLVTGIPAAVDLTVGTFSTCIRTAANEVWCWGANWYGQLGDGTTTNRAMPVRVLLP